MRKQANVVGAFFKRMLRAPGGAGNTFEAFAILVVLPPGKKASRAPLQVCARRAEACQSPPSGSVSPRAYDILQWGGPSGLEGVGKDAGSERAVTSNSGVKQAKTRRQAG